MKNRKAHIAIVGGSGHLGTTLISYLLLRYPTMTIHCIDVNPTPLISDRLIFHSADIRSNKIDAIFKSIHCQVVFHLVGIMSEQYLSRQEIYDIEIKGLKNVLKASARYGTEHFVFISSGAVYGFKPGLPQYISENQPLEVNNPIIYGQNKAIAEQVIQQFTQTHALKTTVFRPCSILGKTTNNMVLNWFDRQLIIGLKETPTPFSFVWDEDLVECMIEAVDKQILGVFNVAAEGWVSLEEIAMLQSKRYIAFTKNRLSRWIGFLNRLSLIKYKKEHLNFIRYRPVLNRNKLTAHFSYHFKNTSKGAFLEYLKFK